MYKCQYWSCIDDSERVDGYCSYHHHMTRAKELLSEALKELDFAQMYKDVRSPAKLTRRALEVTTAYRNDA